MCAKHLPPTRSVLFLFLTSTRLFPTSTTLFYTHLLPLSTRITSSSSASAHGFLLISTRSSPSLYTLFFLSLYTNHLLFLHLAFSILLNSFSLLEASRNILEPTTFLTSRIARWRAAVSPASMFRPAVSPAPAPTVASSIISSTSTSTLSFASARAVPRAFSRAVPHASAQDGSFKFACFQCSSLFNEIATARFHFSHNPHRIPAKKRKYSEIDLEDFIDRRLQGVRIVNVNEVAQIVASAPTVKTDLAAARALLKKCLQYKLKLRHNQLETTRTLKVPIDTESCEALLDVLQNHVGKGIDIAALVARNWRVELSAPHTYEEIEVRDDDDVVQAMKVRPGENNVTRVMIVGDFLTTQKPSAVAAQ